MKVCVCVCVCEKHCIISTSYITSSPKNILYPHIQRRVLAARVAIARIPMDENSLKPELLHLVPCTVLCSQGDNRLANITSSWVNGFDIGVEVDLAKDSGQWFLPLP